MSGPLEGIRVVEIGVWVAGPAAGCVLADWGADVVKIEPPGIGDPERTFSGMSEQISRNPFENATAASAALRRHLEAWGRDSTSCHPGKCSSPSAMRDHAARLDRKSLASAIIVSGTARAAATASRPRRDRAATTSRIRRQGIGRRSSKGSHRQSSRRNRGSTTRVALAGGYSRAIQRRARAGQIVTTRCWRRL